MPPEADPHTPSTLLHRVAQRISDVRALRGLSRKSVAGQAAVSERHLAMVEKGQGNVSLRLLDRIATALGVCPAELLEPEPTDQLRLLNELLGGLDANQQRSAYRLLAEHFQRRASSGLVALVGLRGAGKTTLGAGLAAHHGVPFIRLTALIERRAGLSIAEIHELMGQEGYRRLEAGAVQQAISEHATGVIEAGGGIVANSAAYETLLRDTRVVWLKATPEQHMSRVIEQGDLRPMGGREDAMDDLLAILEQRARLYANAHDALDTSASSTDESLAQLVELTRPYLEDI